MASFLGRRRPVDKDRSSDEMTVEAVPIRAPQRLTFWGALDTGGTQRGEIVVRFNKTNREAQTQNAVTNVLYRRREPAAGGLTDLSSSYQNVVLPSVLRKLRNHSGDVSFRF